MRIVLVRPWRAANVAAACRALKNMGLCAPRLVEASSELLDQLAQPEHRVLAYGAWDLLDGIDTADTLRQATAECTLLVGTSGRPADGAWTPRRLAEEALRLRAGERLAVVFGPESTGLRNDELALCHGRVHIPTDAAQPSLNLAQAVLLLAYELRLAALLPLAGPALPAPDAEPAATRATAGELEEALDDLRRALLAIGYLNPDNPDAILAELRGLLVRARPRPRETSLLRGLARQILWAARRVASGEGQDA